MHLNIKKNFISGVFILMRRVWWSGWNQEKDNGIELEKSNGGERESREKRDYGGERDVDFFFFFGLEIGMKCI